MRLGVDFGGTKIEGALLDSQGEILVRERVPNPGNYEAAVRAVADLTARIEKQTGQRAVTIGVGIPGSLSPSTSKWISRPSERPIQLRCMVLTGSGQPSSVSRPSSSSCA